MEALSPGHLVVIGVVTVVLFFGWRQLPDISRSLGGR
jgi:Sec-independent protein translocase protein TatA